MGNSLITPGAAITVTYGPVEIDAEVTEVGRMGAALHYLPETVRYVGMTGPVMAPSMVRLPYANR